VLPLEVVFYRVGRRQGVEVNRLVAADADGSPARKVGDQQQTPQAREQLVVENDRVTAPQPRVFLLRVVKRFEKGALIL